MLINLLTLFEFDENKYKHFLLVINQRIEFV